MRQLKIVFVGMLMAGISISAIPKTTLGQQNANKFGQGQQNSSQFGQGQQRNTNQFGQGQQSQQAQAQALQQKQMAEAQARAIEILRQRVQRPAGFDISPKHQQYLDKLLTYWETNSSNIKRYKCDFQRWVYDEVWNAERDPKTNHLYARTVAVGKVRYAEPDKGMYQTNNVWKYIASKEPGKEPEYKKIDENEHWVCNGISTFEFKPGEKKVIERPLPLEMRGKNIADGPLPFLFGAKVDEMKARYWIRVITPEDARGEYWLEAYPKRIADAQDMKKVDIILDEKDFLPKAITIYEVNHNPAKQLTRKTTFEFSNRSYNWHELPAGLKKFIGHFSAPRTPLGWEKVVVPLAPQPSRQAQVPKQQPLGK